MDNKKRRSSLRKSLAVDMGPTDMKTQIKRRISFSGKNSVRVFHGEEEPKTWNNSYEISDHLNANETVSNLCVPVKPAILRGTLKNSTENKENFDLSDVMQGDLQNRIDQQQKYNKNVSVVNNVSVLSTTKDIINISYQHQSSKIYQIENSVDITLYEKELRFRVNEDKYEDQTKSKICSFSLEDNEKETKSVMLGERTMDFMRSLEADRSHMAIDAINPCIFASNKDATVFSEFMDEEQYGGVINVKETKQKEPITIYMNDSLSISDKDHISENKRKTQQESLMQLSPNRAQQYNKENIIPVPVESANETQNYSCQMEIEDDIFLERQADKVNVEKESVAFQEKLNRISFLQESDDNMKIIENPHILNPELNVKSRQTVNFNEAIEMSPKTTNINNDKPRSRPTINFHQPIDMSPISVNKTSTAAIQNKSSRTTINFNQPIDVSPNKDNKISTLPLLNKNSRTTINFNQPIEISPSRDNKTSVASTQNKSSRSTINFNKSLDISPKHGKHNVDLDNIKSRPTTNFNQSIEIDSQNNAANNPAQHGAIPKNKSRSTINFNQPIETSPLRTKNNLQRQTLLLREDICESPKLSVEPTRTNNLNIPDSVRKNGQVPKLVVRKICTPLLNKNKNATDLDQQRMLRYKKKQEKSDSGKTKEAAAIVAETEKIPKADKSLNFSLSSVKNMSLSPESLSPLIPSEFKAYNLKQLNDEIERGKINVFSNAPKTPSTDRKFRLAASKNGQTAQSTLVNQRRTLVFDDVDIPISSDTSKNPKSNNYFDFNTTKDDAEQDKRTNTKCRFSQADDIMLDNTSFLTRAKLGDETVSRNSTKREFTQLNDIMDAFNESLMEAASRLDRGITGSNVKSKKSCNTKNDTLSSMFQNAKPIFTQTITTLKDMNLGDAMDISHEIVESKVSKTEQDFDNKKLNSRQTINHDIEICNEQNTQLDNNCNKFICENNEMEIDNDQEETIEMQQKQIEKNARQTIYLNSDIEEQHPSKEHKDLGKTLYLNHEIHSNNKETNSDVVSTFLNNDIQESCRLEKDRVMETNVSYEKISDLKQSHKKENILTNESKQTCEDFNLSTSIIDNEHSERRKERQTIIYDHNMSIEKPLKAKGKTIAETEENTQFEKCIFEDPTRNPTRKTLFLDEEIPFDNPLIETEKNEENKHTDISNSKRNSTRKTLYFNNEIPLEKSQFMNVKDISIEVPDSKINNFKITKNTITNEIPLEEVEVNNQSVEIKNCKSTRKTLYFNNEIAVEKMPESIENNVPNNDAKRKNTRKTMIFNNDIPLEDVEKSNQSFKLDEDIENGNAIRKTICFNNEIALEDVSGKNEDNVKNDNENYKATRKTLYFNQEIDTEKGTICEIGNVNQIDIQNSRKTLYFNNDIPAEKAPIDTDSQIGDHCQNTNCNLEESKGDNIDNKQVSQPRKSVYVAQEMDVTLNETTTARVENNESAPALDVSNNQETSVNNLRLNTLNATKSRKSIYTEECMDLSLDVNDLKKAEGESIEKVCQGKTLNNDSIMNLSIPNQYHMENDELKECKDLAKCENNNLYKENRRTLNFDVDNDMSLDQSLTSAKNEKLPVNAAKLTLSRQIGKSSLAFKTKLTSKDEITLTTPKKFTGIKNPWFYNATPNQSLLDFTKDEKILSEEVRQENNKYLSPLRADNTNKRLPVNITPILSVPKKRHTFDDCHMDFSCNEKLTQAEESKKKEPFRLSKGVVIDHVMEISGIVANNSILETPTKHRKSRIPIPISSGKKPNMSYSLHQSTDVHSKENDDHFKMETEDQLNMDTDILAESIQVMRRATTFLQRDTEIGVKELDVETESEPIKKTSIFEGNPITISDVTVFFEAQRKNNSADPETEATFAVDKMNMSGINDIERAKKSLENRYLNLSLEDIDKTRLSLVRISYEDGTINNTNTSVQEQLDDCVENQEVPAEKNSTDNSPENNVDWKSRRHSINYLRNASTVCRKCKRCQDTFLNETSSSTSESFMLPPLPPLPDLGLDRLRRLRKRPAIADVNVLWQRVSLDRTIINALNISDDDSQIISDLDDQIDDEFSPVIKCIRKYEKEMLSFEMDLLGKHPSKESTKELPFVLRLGNLLSTNRNNWIFDYQMQLRGILLFTHKAMYTFSVSLTFDEIDPFGCDISLKSVTLEKGLVPQKNWKPIDYVLDFQFKLNLPFDLQSLCDCSNEAGIFKMLQTIDRVCLDTIKMVKQLQRICLVNQASIIRDEFRTYVRKIIRKITNKTNSDFKYVEKTEIKIELLNLKKLSFRNIASPPLYYFYEEIHLLPTGLEFLQEFLQKPINYIKHH